MGEEWVLRECPNCHRKEPPFQFDKGADWCIRCMEKPSKYQRPIKAKKVLTPEISDTIIDSVRKKRKYTKRVKVVEVGEMDSDKLTRKRMEEQLDEE